MIVFSNVNGMINRIYVPATHSVDDTHEQLRPAFSYIVMSHMRTL